MASLLILAGAMIHDRVKERKDAKRRKNLEMERNYRLLQTETARRTNKLAGVERNYDSEDEKESEPLPRYEDVVANGEGSSSRGSNNDNQATRAGDAPPDYNRREQRR